MDRIPGLKLLELGRSGGRADPDAVRLNKSGYVRIGYGLCEAIGNPERVVLMMGDNCLAIMASKGEHSRKLGGKPGKETRSLSSKTLPKALGLKEWGEFPAEVVQLEAAPAIMVYLTQDAWATYSHAAVDDMGKWNRK